MKDKLYKMMNWPNIESIVYGEESNPCKILGRQFLSGNTLFQTFQPGCDKVALILDGDDKTYEMELADEEGFFAIAVPGKEKRQYKYQLTDKNGKKQVVLDPYCFEVIMTEEDTNKWNKGVLYDSYKFLGAHMVEKDDISGVSFRVWAPNAMRVGVIGDFNNWNGKHHPMEKDEKTGIFSLFIPELKKGTQYQYEVKIKSGELLRKNDPYSFSMHNGISTVMDETSIRWKDTTYYNNLEKSFDVNNAMNIYEIKNEAFVKEDGTIATFNEIAEWLIPYLKEMKYTHVQFLPIMEKSNGKENQVISFYSVYEKYGTNEEFKEFINKMHKENIGVILEWVPAYFNKAENGLCYFDGTYLYGHMDERMRNNVTYDGFQFNYARPQVLIYLLSSALYWVNECHADGLFVSGLSSMLYLDYGKKDGQWVANIYGGNENLDAIEFIKHLNSILHKNKGVITITKETSAWPEITNALKDGGLGFDYIWNTGFRDDFLTYMEKDYEWRYNDIGELTNNMLYAYCENYILPITYEELQNEKQSLIQYLPGTEQEKEANLRMLLSFYICHPGKKMICKGIENGETKNKGIANFSKVLNSLYQELPALHRLDRSTDGFEWIQCINHNDGVISFLRKGEYIDQTLLVVCNFSNQSYNGYKFGLPYEGKYKEIFLSEEKQFGGDKTIAARVKETKEEDYDGRKNSLTVRIHPLSISIYQYKPYTEEELLEIAEKKVQIIKERLEKEAIKKANELKKMSLKEELENKITEANRKIAKGEEREKAIKVTTKKTK